jgi:arylsulfatase A-like enzyme
MVSRASPILDAMFAAPALFSLAMLLVSCGTGSAPDPVVQPNIVLVSIDTLRADVTSPYRGPLATPGFEALAADGVVFERAYAPAPETAPSHATLITGQDVLRHGVPRNGVPLTADLDTLADQLRDHGHDTAAFVSSWVLDPRFGWGQGFAVYDATFPEEGATMNKQLNRYPGALWLEHEFGGLDRRATATNAAAGRWLDAAREPFFLFVHYFDPHGPYLAPREYWPALRSLEIDLSGRSHGKLKPEQLLGAILGYHGEVLYVDDALSALVARLGQQELARPTLLVVTSDHGEGLGQHGWMEHSIFLYDELVRVPLLFRWLDGERESVRIETPVGLRDVAPTIAELAGMSALAAADGRSLAGSVRNGAEPTERPLFAHRRAYERSSYEKRPGSPGRMASVRTSRWKLIRNWNAEDELYDLENDPGEGRNRLRDERGVAERLDALLTDHLAEMPPVEVVPHLSPEVRRKLEALGYFE